jgi:hypothetical protein
VRGRRWETKRELKTGPSASDVRYGMVQTGAGQRGGATDNQKNVRWGGDGMCVGVEMGLVWAGCLGRALGWSVRMALRRCTRAQVR